MDTVDRAILRALLDDARVTFRELSERVGLSANAVAERVRKLQESGVIRSFKTEVDPAALGFTLRGIIEVKMESATTAAQFEIHTAAVRGVVRALVTTGRYDWLLEVVARDQGDLQRIIEDVRAGGLTRETESRIIATDRAFPLLALLELPTRKTAIRRLK
jgi:Lrp/AsnC family leucine-responsive transcriptional regulator